MLIPIHPSQELIIIIKLPKLFLPCWHQHLFFIHICFRVCDFNTGKANKVVIIWLIPTFVLEVSTHLKWKRKISVKMNQGGSSIKVTSTAVKGQMKGLLKGLRYISQMFDEEDEEKEIQIGFPTDVKHLAHIGCEDAKANAPSWMTEFKETQEPQPSPGAPVNSTKIPEGQDSGNNSDNNSKSGDGKRSHVRRSRHHRSSESQSSMNNSPTREGSNEGSTKPTRRHHSSESSRRNHSHSTEEEDNKPPTTTKHSHRRKSKTTTSEEKENSTRKPSRTRRSSKADSLTDISFTDLGPGPGSGPAAQ